MNHPYTAESHALDKVIVPRRYQLSPTHEDFSLQVSEPDPNSGFVLNFGSPQVFQSPLPLEDCSLGDVPAEGSQLTDYMKIEEAKRYFRENRAEILGKYRGMFVAVVENSIVDCDKDFSELAKRIYEKFGYQTIYMPFVESEPSVLRIPSPRVGKHRVDALRKEV